MRKFFVVLLKPKIFYLTYLLIFSKFSWSFQKKKKFSSISLDIYINIYYLFIERCFLNVNNRDKIIFRCSFCCRMKIVDDNQKKRKKKKISLNKKNTEALFFFLILRWVFMVKEEEFPDGISGIFVLRFQRRKTWSGCHCTTKYNCPFRILRGQRDDKYEYDNDAPSNLSFIFFFFTFSSIPPYIYYVRYIYVYMSWKFNESFPLEFHCSRLLSRNITTMVI